MMQRILFVLLLAMSTLAYGEDNYTRVFAVMADTEDLEPGYALGLGYGRHFSKLLPYFSLEGELSKNFTHMKSGTTAAVQVKRSFWRVAAYAALTYPINRRFSIKGKAGAHHTWFIDRASTAGSRPQRDNIDGLDFGVGALIHLRPSQDILVEYTSTGLNDYTQLILGMQLNF